MQDKLETPDGRPVVLLNIDTTAIKVDQSSDAFAQMDTYSGERGSGHCLLFSNITCSHGSLVCISPSPNISCTPRGGDGTSLGIHLARARENNEGFTRVLCGTPNIGVGVVHDRGYQYDPPNVNRGTNPNLAEFCEDNNILKLTRVKAGEKCFR